jgi:hypothetical protein
MRVRQISSLSWRRPVCLAWFPRAVFLDDDAGSNVYALIRIAAVRGDAADFSVTAGGKAKDPSPVFQIRLKNRSTIWRYSSKTVRSAEVRNEGPMPLTHFGNAGTGQKPSDGVVKIEKTGARISGIVSEIFV